MPAGSNTPSQNIQSLGAGGFYGAYAQGGSGGVPTPRNYLDGQRMAIGKTPDAEYPDGYLGTINSRRNDRGIPTDTVLDSLKNRLTQRSYQRGVHKGERVDPSDYYWGKQFNPQTGLVNQSKGKRTAPMGVLAPNTHLVNDGKANSTSSSPGVIDPARVSQMRSLRPGWS